MKTNEPLTIKQVANGFIVQPIISEYTSSRDGEVEVFQSMAETIGFIARHFEHRCHEIKADPKPAPKKKPAKKAA